MSHVQYMKFNTSAHVRKLDSSTHATYSLVSQRDGERGAPCPDKDCETSPRTSYVALSCVWTGTLHTWWTERLWAACSSSRGRPPHWAWTNQISQWIPPLYGTCLVDGICLVFHCDVKGRPIKLYGKRGEGEGGARGKASAYVLLISTFMLWFNAYESWFRN